MGSEVPPEARSERLVLGNGARISPQLTGLWLRALYESPQIFAGILDSAGRLLDANELAIEGCGLSRDEVVGRPFWECGWWARDPAVAARVREWCRLAAGAPVRGTSDYFTGDGSRRLVDMVLSPVTDPNSGESYLVAAGSDVTDAVQAREQRALEEAKALRADQLDQEHKLQVVQHAQELAVARLRQLIGATVAMAASETIAVLVNDVVERAVGVLGADAGMLAVREGDQLLVTVSSNLSHLPDWTQPLDSHLPMAHVARTGRRLLVEDRESMRAFSAEADRRYAETERQAWGFFPLRTGGRVIGTLAVGWRGEHAIADDEIALLEAFSAQCSQALDRIRHQQDERSAAQRVARLAEALQMSLLTPPRVAHGLQIAVRYQPAAEQARVGGDFYDAFVDIDGATVVAVGDVAGHDTAAAAAMAQIRNLVRGQAYSTTDGPAAALHRLDETLSGLDVQVIATALLVRIEAWAAGARGGRQLTWSNAGHPPAMVRMPDGEVRVLDAQPNLLLGVRPGTDRWEYQMSAPDGTTLLLYTDGLIERRDQDIDESIETLRALFSSVGHESPELICEVLLDKLEAGAGDDDVALVVVRIGNGTALGGHGPAFR